LRRTFTGHQKQAIDTDARDICVAAGAGSGKTGVLVERFVRLVVQSRLGLLPPELRASVDEILVITFTEKATREMKSRIVDELTRLELTEERRRLETAYISTIHGFCSRLLQENPFEVGIDPNFTVLDEPQARRLLRQTIENVVSAAYASGDEAIPALVGTLQSLRKHGEEHADPVASLAQSLESLLSKLRSAGWSRKEIEKHAQSGSAATSAASEAIVWSVVSPAIDEARSCLPAIEAVYSGLLGSARSLCDNLLETLRAIHNAASPGEAVAALHRCSQLLSKNRIRSVGGSIAEMDFAACVNRLKAACEYYVPAVISEIPDAQESALACDRMWRLMAGVWRAYDEAKRRIGKLDNDDLQSECVRLLSEFPDVRERYQRRLRYLMIDEFQDTNPLQMRLIDLLHVKEDIGSPEPADQNAEAPVPRRLPPGRNYLFVVGDVQQSIYGFRGAEPDLFRKLVRRCQRSPQGVHVPLATNFRSRPEILSLIATLYRQIWRSGEQEFVSLDAGSEFVPATAPSVELLLTQDLVRQDYLSIEPSALAERIKQLVESEDLLISSKSDPRCGRPVRYRDVAILLRQLTDIQRYEDALARAGVPYFVVGGGRGYYARQEIRDLVNILTVLDTPFDDIPLLAALRSPMVGANIDTLYYIVQYAHGKHQMRDGLNGDPVSVSARAYPPAVPAGETIPEVTTPAHAEGISQKKKHAPNHKASLPLYLAVQQVLDLHALPAEEDAKLRLFLEVLEPLRAQQDRMPVGHLLERLTTRTLYDIRLLTRHNGKRRLANVRKLVQMAHAEPTLSVLEFVQRLRDLEKLSDREGDAPTEEEAADVVRIHTMHGAKGLEFPVVILADLCRSLEHVERGLFVCDPGTLALGTRVCGTPDATYLAIDHARQRRDKEEAERLLYVAMTRAREHLILCGNLGRNRGRNWGDLLFPALGIIEAPPHPVTQPLIGGQQARVAPLAHYVQTSIVGGLECLAQPTETDGATYADRLLDALLNGTPLESVAR